MNHTLIRAADLPMTPADMAATVARAQRLRLIDAAEPPRLLRRVPVPVGGLPPHADVAYLVDVILARDAWLHRYDIARATGGSVDPDPTSAEVIAQVVRDLALAWQGPDVVLDLTGPEGGTWLVGTNPDAPVVTLPAVEFLRHLSGRVVPADLLAGVPDAARPTLASARVTF